MKKESRPVRALGAGHCLVTKKNTNPPGRGGGGVAVKGGAPWSNLCVHLNLLYNMHVCGRRRTGEGGGHTHQCVGHGTPARGCGGRGQMKFNALWILNVLARTTRRMDEQNIGLRSFIVRTPAVTRYFEKHSSQRGVRRNGAKAVNHGYRFLRRELATPHGQRIYWMRLWEIGNRCITTVYFSGYEFILRPKWCRQWKASSMPKRHGSGTVD